MVEGGDLDDDFATASTRMFAWMTKNEKWSDLRGFPAFSQEEEGSDRDVVWLAPVGQGDEDIPLASVSAWEEDLQQFSELFPPPSILSAAFYDAVPNDAIWQKLVELRIARTNVVVSHKSKLSSFLPDEPLPELDEGARHETRETVDLTDIVFLRGDGIIRRAGRSQRRARLFWRFMTEWLVAHDTQRIAHEQGILYLR